MVGPTIQNDIVEKIILFRIHKFVFTCDIVKMYRQINISPDDFRFQMFLWRINGKVRECALSTVTFGTASAPFTAIRTLFQLSEDMKNEYPVGASIIASKAYVDDIHYGDKSLIMVKDGVKQLVEILRSASFEVRKFASNSTEVLEDIPNDHLEMGDTHNFVGLKWDSKEDVLRLNSVYDSNKKGIYTKREILKNIARIFDPIGWFQPVVIRAKILMQDIWKKNLSWDMDL